VGRIIAQSGRNAIVSRLGCSQNVALRKIIFGGLMWKGIQRRFYSMMYYFGKTPPASAEISSAFDKLEREMSVLADDPLCDCQVLAGPTTIECKTRRTSVCEAMGELRPDVNTVPHKVGFCGGLQEGSR
jgi:hypothetical protein